MSDEFETSEASERTMRVPPLFLLGGFLIVGTAGSAFFVLPSESPTTAVTSMLAIPAGEPVVGQPANPVNQWSMSWGLTKHRLNPSTQRPLD